MYSKPSGIKGHTELMSMNRRLIIPMISFANAISQPTTTYGNCLSALVCCFGSESFDLFFFKA